MENFGENWIYFGLKLRHGLDPNTGDTMAKKFPGTGSHKEGLELMKSQISGQLIEIGIWMVWFIWFIYIMFPVKKSEVMALKPYDGKSGYLQESFNIDCLKLWGRILTGKYAHYCNDWDGLPVDETCDEFQSCRCNLELFEID